MKNTDLNELIQGDTTPMRALREELRRSMNCALPGLVTAYDPTTQTATVQPAIRGRFKDTGYVDLPLLTDVPVYFPGGKTSAMTFPVSAGDECLVVFADACIDAWYQSGSVQNPISLRRHDLSDGFAFVGFRSRPNALNDVPDTPSFFGASGGGVDGKSAYELAVEEGYTGTLEDWLASLHGADGADGAPGRNGVDGADGKDGINGTNGVNGKDGVDGAPGKDGLTTSVNGKTQVNGNVTLTAADVGAAPTEHTHSYAGSDAVGGAANSVKGSLSIKVNGTSTNTFNGSVNKEIDISPRPYISLSATGLENTECTTAKLIDDMPANSEVVFRHSTDHDVKLTDLPGTYGIVKLSKAVNSNYAIGFFTNAATNKILYTYTGSGGWVDISSHTIANGCTGATSASEARSNLGIQDWKSLFSGSLNKGDKKTIIGLSKYKIIAIRVGNYWALAANQATTMASTVVPYDTNGVRVNTMTLTISGDSVTFSAGASAILNSGSVTTPSSFVISEIAGVS